MFCSCVVQLPVQWDSGCLHGDLLPWESPPLELLKLVSIGYPFHRKFPGPSVWGTHELYAQVVHVPCCLNVAWGTANVHSYVLLIIICSLCVMGLHEHDSRVTPGCPSLPPPASPSTRQGSAASPSLTPGCSARLPLDLQHTICDSSGSRQQIGLHLRCSPDSLVNVLWTLLSDTNCELRVCAQLNEVSAFCGQLG